jgi:hypothetical protein
MNGLTSKRRHTEASGVCSVGKTINGGNGTDTLRVNGAGLTLDLRNQDSARG